MGPSRSIKVALHRRSADSMGASSGPKRKRARHYSGHARFANVVRIRCLNLINRYGVPVTVCVIQGACYGVTVTDFWSPDNGLT